MSRDDIHRPSTPSLPHRPIPLTLHKLLDNFSFSANNCPPAKLNRLLCDLRKAGFQMSSQGTDRGPDVLLTLDDGYEHYREVLPPILERFAVHPVIFVPTAWTGSENRWDYSYHFQRLKHLSKQGIRELAELGVRYGTHGHRHVSLTGLGEGQIAEELRVSKEKLEDILGKEVNQISYPYGRISNQVIEIAREVGYASGYTTRLPAKEDDPLSQGRIPVFGFDSSRVILRRLRGRWLAWERMKTGLVSRLSGGTILLNRVRGFKEYPS